MRGRILLLYAASLLPWTAADAQPLPADPDPAALEVARRIIATTPIVTRPVNAEQQARELEWMLLSPGAIGRSCDRANPECLAAARAVAREFAPRMGARADRRRERILAYQLADRLRPEQLRRMAAFFRSEDGRAFVEAWQMLWRTPPPSRERQREIEQQASAGEPDPWRDATRRFQERTAHLPRSREAPPVVMPPAPPRPPPPPRP